jgi:hypothetical protein
MEVTYNPLKRKAISIPMNNVLVHKFSEETIQKLKMLKDLKRF